MSNLYVHCNIFTFFPGEKYSRASNWTSYLIFINAQVAKWMLGKGQGATMATYDTLLLAFDVDGRVDEAESLWNMILHTHTRSISKRLFSRMISLYDHHDMQDKIIEVCTVSYLQKWLSLLKSHETAFCDYSAQVFRFCTFFPSLKDFISSIQICVDT